MVIDYPLGTYRDGRWVGYRLTTGDRYLLMTPDLDKRLQDSGRATYWRFMARRLRQIGLTHDASTAWRAFAD